MRIRITAGIVILFAIVLLLGACHRISTSENKECYPSPQGTHTIIVNYNFVGRPTLYVKRMFRKERIGYWAEGWDGDGYYYGEWLSENEFRFCYDDKDDEFDVEFTIVISEDGAVRILGEPKLN